ncbi:unnamed protein product [Acidithrix sp. C25]|nr:unnamed protein product [Acidithrix sp. C25]
MMIEIDDVLVAIDSIVTAAKTIEAMPAPTDECGPRCSPTAIMRTINASKISGTTIIVNLADLSTLTLLHISWLYGSLLI